MNTLLDEVLSWIFKSLLYDGILMPLFQSLNSLSTDDVIFDALKVDTFFGAMRSIGLAVFSLVVAWQALKSMFGFAGLEVDDPAKLIFKSIIIGVALGNSKSILTWGMDISNGIIRVLLSVVYTGSGSFNPSETATIGHVFDVLTMQADFTFTGIDALLGLVINIIILFKLLGIYLRMVERIVLNGFLIIGAPLAFAAGASQPTKGFFQGFIKVYIGNMIVMILQNLGVVILMTYMLEYKPVEGNTLVGAFVALAIAKVISKLEDIVRDMSVGVGVGRDMGSAMQTIQSAAYSGPMVINAIKSFKG